MSPASLCNTRGSARSRWALAALTALLLSAFGATLEHVALAPAVGHADCAVCQSAHQALPVVIVLVVFLVATSAPVITATTAIAFGRCPLSFQGRAPPTLSHR